jgi:uncharacterized coiled-coil protein SlyX
MFDAETFVSELLSEDIPASALSHAYDPAKAREYYLRTRKLKGRKKGSTINVGAHQKKEAHDEHSENQRLKKIAANKKLKAAAEARVDHLQARLDRLKEVLEELTKQAKARSGVETKTTTKEKAENKKANEKADSKPKTAAEKHADAKASKESREKDGDPSLHDQAKDITAKIAEVRKSIAKMKAQLAEAKKKTGAKDKPSSSAKKPTAWNGRSQREGRR